jgi:hypothetical protein
MYFGRLAEDAYLISLRPMAKPLPKDDVLKMFFKEFALLPIHARVQITVAHCYLELLVHLLAVHKCKNRKRIEDSNRDYPHSVKIVLLHEMGLISGEQAEILHWFRKMRNDAAHQADFSLSKEDLRLFKGWKTGPFVSEDGKYKISIPLDDPKNIHHLCVELVMGFWNTHPTFFYRLFNPETATPSTKP